MGFPKDKDLPAGSTIAATVLTAEILSREPPERIGDALRGLAKQHARPCDMVILCVEPGYGQRFAEGLVEGLASDPTAVIDPI